MSTDISSGGSKGGSRFGHAVVRAFGGISSGQKIRNSAGGESKRQFIDKAVGFSLRWTAAEAASSQAVAEVRSPGGFTSRVFA